MTNPEDKPQWTSALAPSNLPVPPPKPRKGQAGETIVRIWDRAHLWGSSPGTLASAHLFRGREVPEIPARPSGSTAGALAPQSHSSPQAARHFSRVAILGTAVFHSIPAGIFFLKINNIKKFEGANNASGFVLNT